MTAGCHSVGRHALDEATTGVNTGTLRTVETISKVAPAGKVCWIAAGKSQLTAERFTHA